MGSAAAPWIKFENVESRKASWDIAWGFKSSVTRTCSSRLLSSSATRLQLEKERRPQTIRQVKRGHQFTNGVNQRADWRTRKNIPQYFQRQHRCMVYSASAKGGAEAHLSDWLSKPTCNHESANSLLQTSKALAKWIFQFKSIRATFSTWIGLGIVWPCRWL